jgi:hypothetical protein
MEKRKIEEGREEKKSICFRAKRLARYVWLKTGDRLINFKSVKGGVVYGN